MVFIFVNSIFYCNFVKKINIYKFYSINDFITKYLFCFIKVILVILVFQKCLFKMYAILFDL